MWSATLCRWWFGRILGQLGAVMACYAGVAGSKENKSDREKDRVMRARTIISDAPRGSQTQTEPTGILGWGTSRMRQVVRRRGPGPL